jgi:hypothetical protein
MILRSFYNGAFSIASKHDFDDQFFLLAIVVLVMKGTAIIVFTIMEAPIKFHHSSVIVNMYLCVHFLPVLLKSPLYQLELNIPSSSCTPTRRSRTEILWARGALPHASPYTTLHYTISMYSLFENKRTIFTKF